MEELLEMKAGDLEILLRPITSLVCIDGDKVRFLHKALFDYLLDFDRSRLPFDLSRAHEVAARHILKQRIVKHVAGAFLFPLISHLIIKFISIDLDDFRRFAWHCRFSYPNIELRHYLRSLEVPFPKCVMTGTTTNSNSPEWDMTAISVIWHFFRTLCRKVVPLLFESSHRRS